MDYEMTQADYDRVNSWLTEHADDCNVQEIIRLCGLIEDNFTAPAFRCKAGR